MTTRVLGEVDQFLSEQRAHGHQRFIDEEAGHEAEQGARFVVPKTGGIRPSANAKASSRAAAGGFQLVVACYPKLTRSIFL